MITIAKKRRTIPPISRAHGTTQGNNAVRTRAMSENKADDGAVDGAAGVLEGRPVPGSVNLPEVLAAHLKRNDGKTRTRFPPEPNGYLHIGHAKSMYMNFEGAFEKLGVPMEKRETYLRFDDTNPGAESVEYIDSIKENVAWLGYKPTKITHSSDVFDELYASAVSLIERGKAYVCHQTGEEMKASREMVKKKHEDPKTKGNPESPWRNRSVEENLKFFNDMRMGVFSEGTTVLRMKGDMTHVNPNMWDHVAYRIMFLPHPMCGDKWCVALHAIVCRPSRGVWSTPERYMLLRG